jgi:hypothetical protein
MDMTTLNGALRGPKIECEIISKNYVSRTSLPFNFRATTNESIHRCNMRTTMHSDNWGNISVMCSTPIRTCRGKCTLINPLTPELNPSAQRCLTRFFLGILLLEACISLIYAWKTSKCNNYSFSLLIMYGSSYMLRHYIPTMRECS